jgi:D-alanyl-D-alanine carboxypeptidase (penicillin-binding protein 5/6)
VAAVAVALVQLERQLPPLRVSVELERELRVGGHRPTLPWPTGGSAAVEVVGAGSLGAARGAFVTPLASVSKLMTALVVLKRHPLARGGSGPDIPITAPDVSAYQADLAAQQSVLEVRAGEQLDELQALEGLLVPSANNIALVLAKWDAGSVNAFVAQMNAMAASLGLRHTHFVEPSGLAPGNAGTALDMMRLGADALANPTIASIVKKGEVDLPVAGIVLNYNYAVGHHNIIGIKTGSSIAAGGNFVFAARRTVDGRAVTVIGAVLDQKGVSQLDTALSMGERLAAAAFGDVRTLTVTRAGAIVVRVHAPWSSREIVGRSTESARYFGVPGAEASFRIALDPTLSHADHVRSGERLATVTVRVATHTYTIPVVASGSLPSPSLTYRLERR